MYKHEAGRSIKLKTEAFGKVSEEVRKLSLITGVRVAGVGEVKDTKSGGKSQTISFGKGRRLKYATAFDEAISGLKDIQVGDLVNLEVLPTSPLFRFDNPDKPGEKLIATPRMSKIFQAEKTTPAETVV